MPNAIETSRDIPALANSLEEIQSRVAAGRISWAGPLLLVAARPVLFLTIQSLIALFLFALHRPAPMHRAGQWWNVYGTFVDIGCLVGLRFFTRREGIRLRDLIGPSVCVTVATSSSDSVSFCSSALSFSGAASSLSDCSMVRSPSPRPYTSRSCTPSPSGHLFIA